MIILLKMHIQEAVSKYVAIHSITLQGVNMHMSMMVAMCVITVTDCS